MTKTLENWKMFMERTGKKNTADYFNVGDVVNADLIDYIRANIPLETDTPDYIQLSKIQAYYYDIARTLRPVYYTFSEYDNEWRYHGICYKWETINRS